MFGVGEKFARFAWLGGAGEAKSAGWERGRVEDGGWASRGGMVVGCGTECSCGGSVRFIMLIGYLVCGHLS